MHSPPALILTLEPFAAVFALLLSVTFLEALVSCLVCSYFLLPKSESLTHWS